MSPSYVIFFITLLICLTQAGPALPRHRTILGPQVSQAQMVLQEDYLTVEAEVLRTSIQISSIVQWITKESFRVADEVKASLTQAMDSVSQMENASLATMDLKAQKCIKGLSIQEQLGKTKSTLWNQIYQCTHTQSDQAVKTEKKMTGLMNSAREHIMQTMDSMWLCELQSSEDVKPWSKAIDKDCLISLQEEGKEINHVLPEKANSLLAEAKNYDATTPSILQKCMIQCLSTMSEKTTAVLQKLKYCTKRS